MDKRKVIIDCDPGIDDILALALLRNESVDVAAISTVAGNTDVMNAYLNAKIFARLSRWNVPVIMGSSRPIGSKPDHASFVHGDDGLAGLQEKYLMMTPMTREAPLPFIALKDLIDREDKVDVIAVGPLTNLAILLSAYPNLVNKINSVHIMGGGFGMGNVTPLAEFNFNYDALAVQMVLNSGVNVVLSPLNTTHEVYFDENELDLLVAKHPALDLVKETLSYYMERDPYLHDVVSVLTLTQPDLFHFSECEVAVSTLPGDTCGMIYSKEGSNQFVKVASVVDRESVIKAIITSLNLFIEE